MNERPVQFGPDYTLVGMLTRPVRSDPPTLAFLMFNAGVLPRIGPHRLNVKLARALAGDGQTSLRFDLSGQGDSRSSSASGGDFRAQAVRDIRHAMDHLEQTLGIHRFALIGVCSGAVNAHAAALADERVAGVLLFDGHWYRSRWTRLVRDWKRFRNQSWTEVAVALRRRLGSLVVPSSRTHLPRSTDGDGVPLGNLPRAEFVGSMQSLVNRGVAIFLMYSGSVIDYYSYANQFRDAFCREAFVEHVRCDFCPDIDHTFVSLDAQTRMITSVRGWVPEVQRAGSSLS